MTTAAIKILLSHQPAEACWGENALLSLSDSSITLHLKPTDTLSLVQKGGRNIDKQGIRHVVLSGEHWDLEHCWAFWQGFRAPKGQQTVEWPYLSAEDKTELDRRLAIIDWVRDIINLPAEDLGPEQLAHAAVDLLTDLAPEATSYRIVKGEDLREQGYHGLHTVGRGSSRSPTLLTLDYNPSDDNNTPVFCCLVGKGITFDTGGYSLKPSGPMDSMKSDMGGAAMLTGALALAITHGLTKRIKLILCCADNMVSGNALRLGDIIRYRNGKSVEVMNTDAEGRLVLADGLIDASGYQPELLIDAATLTGAAKVALGTDYHALFSFDDDCAQQLLRSAQSEGEMFWRLPLAEFHRHRLPSYFADLNNIDSGAHTAGASSAAAFLSWFVSDYQTGWLHIDCSATYRKTAVDLWSAGATGIGVRTLANILLK